MTAAGPSIVHVCHVVPGLMPGGMELTMSRIVSALAQRGSRHTILCLKGEAVIRDRLPEEVTIHTLHSFPNEPGLPLRLLRLFRAIRPTAIHARNWGAWPDTALARLATRPRVPLVFSLHGFGDAGPLPLRRRVAFRLLPRITTHLFTLSNASRRALIEQFGWPRRCEVIPNGVDTDRFHPPSRREADARLILGTVGNLRPVKNQALLLRAVADLVARDLDVHLRIAGKGDERPRLEALARSLGIADRVAMNGHEPDVPAFLRNLDLFALTSDSEQHPNALTEAMATGLPCVATRVGGVEELLEAGRCGRIVPPGDLQGLAAALNDLCRDADARRRLGQAARTRACNVYSNQRCVDAYDRLYHRMSRRILSRRDASRMPNESVVTHTEDAE